jgi:uncharacterized membrane protein
VALIDPNAEVKRLRDLEDRIADGITAFAGNMKFVYFHSIWFGLWILANLGLLGAGLVFDTFPFGLLTMVVSLEAIFLSTFVMISQNREARATEIRSRLDYQTNVQAAREIEVVMKTLERLAEHQGVDIADLREEFSHTRRLAQQEVSRKSNQTAGKQPR